MEEEGGLQVVARTSELPFGKLPNLPSAVIPQIDLGISRVDVLALLPTLSDKKKAGVFCTEQCTQTVSTEIVSLKNVTELLTATLEEIGQLRKELSFAHHVLRADYEKRIEWRALQLYNICLEKIRDLERRHEEKVDVIRRSHRTQLMDAISKISGEYKSYYDEIMGGKAGKQEARIRELKHQLAVCQAKLEMHEGAMEKLKEEAAMKAAEKEATSDLPPGITMEEALELRETISKLELELEMVQQDVADKEDSIRRITRRCDSYSHQLEEEKSKHVLTKQRFEEFRSKAQQEKEMAARLAQNRQDALEREWKDKMHSAEQDAVRKASEEADLQRMRDQATFQQELERRKAMEEQLREQTLRAAADVSTKTAGDGELGEMVEKLQKENSAVKVELGRLKFEYDRTVQLYETKLEILQRNFHALRDESFIRKKLEHRSGLLRHSTIGYSASLSPHKKAMTSDVPGGVRPAEGRSQHGSEGRGRVHFQIGPSKNKEILSTPRKIAHLKEHTPSPVM